MKEKPISTITKQTVSEFSTQSLLDQVIEKPHLLGHVVGKDKLTEVHSHWIKYTCYPTEYFLKDDKWRETYEFFNSLGGTIDVIEDGNIIKREQLTEEKFLELIKQKKRSLQAHRGSYKSTALDVIGAIVLLLFNFDFRICIIRKDFTKASEILQSIKLNMKKPEIKYLFQLAHGVEPKEIKSRDNILTYNFKQSVTPEGNVNAYGIHGDITGKHFDFIFFDDFITLEDKISRAEREKTKLRIEEIAENVLDPDRYCCFIGTPWHKEDAWQLCPEPLKFDCYMLDILSEEQIINKRKSTTNITFCANYELKHANAEDALFKDPNYERWQFKYKTGIGHIDKAYKGGDTNALTFVCKKDNGRYQVLGKIWPDNIKTHFKDIKSLWEKYRIGTVYTEDNDDKGFSADILKSMGILTKTYHENQNKHVKIQDYILGNDFWNLIDFDPETDPEYMNQLLDYMEGAEPDDAPDSLSCLGRILFPIKSERKYTDMFSVK